MTLSDVYVGYKLASVSYLHTTRVACKEEIVEDIEGKFTLRYVILCNFLYIAITIT